VTFRISTISFFFPFSLPMTACSCLLQYSTTHSEDKEEGSEKEK
jgi:hypothetical protein